MEAREIGLICLQIACVSKMCYSIMYFSKLPKYGRHLIHTYSIAVIQLRNDKPVNK